MSQSISSEEIFELMTAKPCYVYCVRAEEYSSSVKIGISDNPTQRLRQLDSTVHPLTYYFSHIRKFRSRDEAFSFEQNLLSTFSYLRGKGEWLNLDDKLSDHIHKNLDQYTDYKLLELSERHRVNLAETIQELADEYIKELSMISPVRIKSSARQAVLSQFFYLVFIRNLIVDSAKNWNGFCHMLKSFELAEIAQESISNTVGNQRPRKLAFLNKTGLDLDYIHFSSFSAGPKARVTIGDESYFEISNELGEAEFINFMLKVTEGDLSLNRIKADSFDSPKLYDLIWSFVDPEKAPYLWRKP